MREMRVKSKEIMDAFENTSIPVVDFYTKGKYDVIEIENSVYAQGGVLSGVLEDHGYEGGLGEYITCSKIEHQCEDEHECDCEPDTYVMELEEQ